ncbi:peptidase S1 family protein [Caenibius tardaugens NBRC 16725]|uniref:Peptidase S1 family protein n=2 Tax=Caenibius TaxID=2827482 RepID=U2YIW9_9SPHN|nr:serine protease [Caenibius tardaugens]GAD48102.1 peptidase S1 family protein [Caenibius tardaugens NBRC 16725]
MIAGLFPRVVAALALFLGLFALPSSAGADPSDVAAAARGVVRVVVLGHDGDQLYPISHGTGFVVQNNRIVTNAHVVREVMDLPGLTLGIVPPQGGAAVAGRVMAYSPKNDLALIETTEPLNLPPLAIASTPPQDGSQVAAVGYPMNVDRAQGLSVADVLRPQPPVKSQGFVSGERPTREFDTILHTAPIARGNSGGPLLDSCGRVIGANSFGTDSQGADAEFFFAVSAREILPFLRANGVEPVVNGLPCRSLAELDAQERAQSERDARAAMELAHRQEAESAQNRENARRDAMYAIVETRDNRLALAGLLLALSVLAGLYTWHMQQTGDRRRTKLAGAVTGVLLIAMLVAWFTRPGMNQVEQRAVAALAKHTKPAAEKPKPVANAAAASKLVCTIDLSRSRVTTADTPDVPLTWSSDGCVNSRSQYGLSGGQWSRVLVPQDEEAVSVARYSPDKREYRVERYLLDHNAMSAVRTERAKYQPPACGGGEARARSFGDQQASLTALLPTQPNERLVYTCRIAN